MKKYFYSLLLSVFSVGAAVAQTCPPSYQPAPFQDCIGATALCNIENQIDDGQLCGPGRTPGEVVSTGCGTSEHISSWYQFIARRPGRFRFRIIPNDVSNLNDYSQTDGSRDYDWILYKLPAGSTAANASTCGLIRGNSTYQISCNYSGQTGVTGIYDELGADNQGNSQTAAGTRFNDPLIVNAGDFFLLMVDNFRSDTVGYRILFDDPDADPTSTDIRQQQEPPRLDSVIATPTCVDNRLIFEFNKPILCRDINTFTFGITNANFPNQVFTIDSIRGVGDCSTGLSSTPRFVVGFSPVLVDSTYQIVLRDTIRDICNNKVYHDTIRFTVRPFVRLESFVNSFKQDSACCGTEVILKATPDENLRTRPGAFRYQFFRQDSVSGLYTPLPDADYRVDSNQVTTQQACSPFKTSFRLKVIATNPRFGCTDSSFAKFRYNPKPPMTLTNVPGLCFGESAQIVVYPAPADSSLFQYEWTSKLPGSTQRIPKRGDLTIVNDTVSKVDAATGTIYRAQNDELTLKVKYKAIYGGCPADPQKATIAAGAYMKAGFRSDTIQRPGKVKPSFILADRSYFDTSVVRSLDGVRNNNRPELWTVTNQGSNSVIYSLNTYGPVQDSVQISFRDSTKNNAVIEGNYLVRLVISDTLYKGTEMQKVCKSEATQLYNVVDPVIPNILTTNGDNVNDYFEIPDLLKARNYTLTVINRWGRVVFKQSNYDNSFKASDFPAGTYFYNLEPSVSGRTYKGWLEVLKK